MSNKDLTQINKAYKKRFKLLNKNLSKEPDAGLLLFAEHLKYLRDTAFIASTEVDDPETEICTKAATLIVATAEFDAYQNYEEKEKKDFHWDNFCELIRLNMREWLSPNDTI